MAFSRIVRRLIVLLAFCLAGAALPASADDSVSLVKASNLPPLAAGDGATMVALGGRTVVIGPNGAWALAADRRAWQPLDRSRLPADRKPRIVASNGQRAVLLRGDAHAMSNVAMLQLDNGALSLRTLPALPQPLTVAQAVVSGETVTIAGRSIGGTARVLDLTLGDPSWRVRAPWPGAGTPTTLAVQNGVLYLTLRNGAAEQLLAFGDKDGWKGRGSTPGPVLAGAARAIGQAHILYLVSDTKRGTQLYAFHTITAAWAAMPYRATGGVDAGVAAGNGLVLAHADGGRMTFAVAELERQRRALDLLDWTIIIVYMAAMLGVGGYMYRRAKLNSTSDFFLGSRSIPFWAAGVSMFAGNTSSISYLAIPAKAFETNWEYMTSKIVTVFGLMFVAIWVVPALRRLNLVSVFNYLEQRFHPAIRMLASALCIAMHVGGRMGVVLFLPALAIGTITGFNVIGCICILGVCTIIYTALGGMRAVIWTDFIQVIVLMGGALFAIGYIVWSLGFTAIEQAAMASDKTHMINTSFDFTQPTLWGFLILILFDTVLTFPKDQILMQRALATSSDKNAGRSIWLFAAVLLPGGLIFYVIGTVLFAYYQAHPARLDPLLPIDAVFPSFIGMELPHGVTGLIIAGLFAAAMGTLSGTINSVATLLSVDFYEKFAKNPTQKKTVRFAEWMTVLVGVVGIGLAVLLSQLDIHSLLDLSIELFGVLGGSCAGAYTLGMFTRRANAAGVGIGIVAASAITLAASIFHLVHPYFYLAIAIFVSIAVGYVASLFFPAPQRSLEGLIVPIGRFGRRRTQEDEPSTSIS
ncbi:sodium/solute symporter [Sphingomonas sp. So64.6b]|uniref:sodium:solute symporter n=1 Tax=Sphingomonas sp. So64.6b TaxID=2997354 RepID=UPI0015FEE5DD|nr:sodium:solute symporter [Sphingomonas sp. So64.6b]QNA86350.1 sodium/solute symporter [Sphingomonas sp. So64.6b]